MHRVRTASTVIALAAVAAVGMSAPAHAAGTRTTFTVDTQFVPGDSLIVDASGPLAACTSVTDASNEPQGRTHSQALFSGNKILHCGASTVVVGYEAFITFPAPAASGGASTTHGTWWIEESDLPGATSGGGTLMGDARGCELAPGSQGCILDVFMGSVS